MLVLINLDSAVERRHAMTRQLKDCNLAFERVGVDLRCLRSTEVDQEILSRFPNLRFDRQVLSSPEIGCWLSHLTAWQALLEQTRRAACTVIEDDLTLLPGFAHAVNVLSGLDLEDAGRSTQAVSPFDVVYFGTSSRSVSQRRRTVVAGLFVHRAVGLIFNTWGYSITRAYAQRFFAGASRREIRIPIDHFRGGRGGRLGPRIGVLQPAVLLEDPVLGADSQIAPYTYRIDRSPIFESARRRLLASSVSDLYYSLVYRYL